TGALTRGPPLTAHLASLQRLRARRQPGLRFYASRLLGECLLGYWIDQDSLTTRITSVRSAASLRSVPYSSQVRPSQPTSAHSMPDLDQASPRLRRVAAGLGALLGLGSAGCSLLGPEVDQLFGGADA